MSILAPWKSPASKRGGPDEPPQPVRAIATPQSTVAAARCTAELETRLLQLEEPLADPNCVLRELAQQRDQVGARDLRESIAHVPREQSSGPDRPQQLRLDLHRLKSPVILVLWSRRRLRRCTRTTPSKRPSKAGRRA